MVGLTELVTALEVEAEEEAEAEEAEAAVAAGDAASAVEAVREAAIRGLGGAKPLVSSESEAVDLLC